jgi:hypothetical protein
MKVEFRAWAFGLLALFGCASGSQFSPTYPIEKAPSLQEGLLTCNEYNLPKPSRRPNELIPFLTCLDHLSKQFQTHLGNHPFQTFRLEFHKAYNLIREDEWTDEMGENYRLAVHAILRRLSQGALHYYYFTRSEQKLAIQLFPKTAVQLKIRNWKISPSAQFDPELEKIYAGIDSLLPENLESELTGSRPFSPYLTPDFSEDFCGNIRILKSSAAQLYSLWRDLSIMSHVAVTRSKPFKRTLQNYQDLMTQTKEKIEILRTIPRTSCA